MLHDAALARLQTSISTPDLDSTPYELIGSIGSGGMGSVYEVRDTRLNRKVALKVLHDPDSDNVFEQRLRREAQIVGALEHPGIVPLYDIGRLADGRLYYTMRLVKGRTLDDWLATDQGLPAALRVFLTICRTVAFAHARGLIHRDLKPDNIKVTEFGGVYVLDWGVAKFLDGRRPEDSEPDSPTGAHSSHQPANPKLTSAGLLLGTPDFMPPEQAAGRAEAHDKRSDVWALGTILQKLVENNPGKLRLPLRRMGQRPAVLHAIINTARAQAADERYADAAEMAAEIEALLDGRQVRAYRENFMEKLLRLAHKHRFVLGLLAMYFLVRIILYILAFFAAPS